MKRLYVPIDVSMHSTCIYIVHVIPVIIPFCLQNSMHLLEKWFTAGKETA